MKLNFGSGNDPLEGFINVDFLKRDDVDFEYNLMDFPYPWDDNSVEEIRAIDVIEHLDHYTDKSSPVVDFHRKPTIMCFIEECYRILQPGGLLYIQTPHWDSDLFKIDVTHVRGFHENSFDFFDDETYYGSIRGFYSGAAFKVRCEMLENRNLRFWLVKK